jgi:dienelactone hydrolase
MVKPYVDAGFVVMVPMLRGENGQAGSFSMFYDEVDDVIAATKFLKKQPSVDPARMFLAGHSAGGTIALLAAQTSQHFRAAAAFDGSPDQQLLFNGSAQRAWVPKEVVFDRMDLRELQVLSPLAYATSFKCPARLYYSTEASILYSLPSQRTASVAKEAGLDVEAIMIEGNHISHVAPAMKQSILFFRNTDRAK